VCELDGEINNFVQLMKLEGREWS